MQSLISGIHHVALKCCGSEEFERAVRFYRDTLRLEIVREWGEGEGAGIMLSTGAGIIEIFANAEECLPRGAVRHFALATSDVDRCIEAVRNAGYKATVEPKNVDIPSQPPFPIRVAFCIGPVGEEIEFFEERRQ